MDLGKTIAALPWLRRLWRFLPGPLKLPLLAVAAFMWWKRRGEEPQDPNAGGLQGPSTDEPQAPPADELQAPPADEPQGPPADEPQGPPADEPPA